MKTLQIILCSVFAQLLVLPVTIHTQTLKMSIIKTFGFFPEEEGPDYYGFAYSLSKIDEICRTQEVASYPLVQKIALVRPEKILQDGMITDFPNNYIGLSVDKVHNTVSETETPDETDHSETTTDIQGERGASEVNDTVESAFETTTDIQGERGASEVNDTIESAFETAAQKGAAFIEKHTTDLLKSFMPSNEDISRANLLIDFSDICNWIESIELAQEMIKIRAIQQWALGGGILEPINSNGIPHGIYMPLMTGRKKEFQFRITKTPLEIVWELNSGEKFVWQAIEPHQKVPSIHKDTHFLNPPSAWKLHYPSEKSIQEDYYVTIHSEEREVANSHGFPLTLDSAFSRAAFKENPSYILWYNKRGDNIDASSNDWFLVIQSTRLPNLEPEIRIKPW